MNRIFIQNIFISFIILCSLYSVNYVYGQVMSGGSYRIQSDSVNFGGNFSTSTTYFIQDTIGEVATGESASTNFKVKAGYQNMQENIISMSAISGMALTPAIGGISGGTANSSTTFTVITDDPAGYMVMIKASSTPAMRSPLDTIADYISSTTPDYAFSILPSQSMFGFTVEGVDIDQRFKNNSSNVCATGLLDNVDACWSGLSTTNQTIVNRTSANQPAGTVTALKFRAQVGTSRVQINGTYIATTTITAILL